MFPTVDKSRKEGDSSVGRDDYIHRHEGMQEKKERDEEGMGGKEERVSPEVSHNQPGTLQQLEGMDGTNGRLLTHDFLKIIIKKLQHHSYNKNLWLQSLIILYHQFHKIIELIYDTIK